MYIYMIYMYLIYKKLFLYHLGQFFCLFVLLAVMKKLNYFFLSLYCLKGRKTSTAESI